MTFTKQENLTDLNSKIMNQSLLKRGPIDQ